MTEQEMSVKLAETESRARSNTRRIEKLEQKQNDLEKLVAAVQVLAAREQSVKADVKTITEKPGKRWDTLIDRVLYALLGAAVSLLAAGGQL